MKGQNGLDREKRENGLTDFKFFVQKAFIFTLGPKGNPPQPFKMMEQGRHLWEKSKLKWVTFGGQKGLHTEMSLDLEHPRDCFRDPVRITG